MTKQKIVEEPILEINVKVDQEIDGKYQGRLNWVSMNSIDLIDIFNTTINNEQDNSAFQISAERKTMMFKRRLQQYIIDKCDAVDGVAKDDDTSEIKNFDWQHWLVS